MITREQAHELAQRFLAERGPLAGWDRVERVMSPEEVESQLHPRLRGVVPNDARRRDCWTVYIAGTAGGVIQVSRSGGTIEFAGVVRGEPRAHSG